jgi:hypothetical protein
MATSGPITYLVMEDQFPSVAAPWERLQSANPHSCGLGETAQAPGDSMAIHADAAG